jgi:hypothetical protein
VKEVHEVIAFYVSGDDRPGIIGRYARQMAEAGVNIERMYVAAGSRLAFVTDNHLNARAAIRGRVRGRADARRQRAASPIRNARAFPIRERPVLGDAARHARSLSDRHLDRRYRPRLASR